MKISVLKHAAYAAMGFCFLVASGAMARYYFTYDEKHARQRDETKTRIADRLTADWLNPDLDDITKQFRVGPLDKFDMIIMNAAMGRWRVKSIAPHAYPRLISDFKNGWWDDSFVDGLTPLLTEMDRKWKEERTRNVLSGKNRTAPKLEPAGEVGFGLVFSPGTTTAQLGTVIEILLTAGPDSTPHDYAMALWATEQNPDVSPWRSQRCTLADTKETSGGLPVYRISVDMADCAEWISTETKPTVMHFRGDPPVKWFPYAFTLKDSPLLPVGLDDEIEKGLSPDSK